MTRARLVLVALSLALPFAVARAEPGPALPPPLKLDGWKPRVAYLPRGDVLVTHSDRVQLWSTETWERRDLTGTVWSFALSPRGDRIATYDVDKRVVDVTNLDTGALVASYRLEPYHSGSALAFSGDGELLAIGGCCRGSGANLDAGHVGVWSISQQKVLANLPHDGPVAVVAFAPEGDSLVTGGEFEGLRLWAARRGRLVAKLPCATGYLARGAEGCGATWHSRIAFSPRGDVFAAATTGHVDIRSTVDGACLRRIETRADDSHRGDAYLAFSARGDLLAVGRPYWSELELRAVKDGALVAKLNVPTTQGEGPVVAFSPRGDVFALAFAQIRNQNAAGVQFREVPVGYRGPLEKLPPGPAPFAKLRAGEAPEPAPMPAPTPAAPASAPAPTPLPAAPAPSATPLAPAPAPSQVARAPLAAGRTFVLVVGVNAYDDKRIPALRFAEQDARAVFGFYATESRSPTDPDRVKLLLGEDATREGILRAIREHLALKATRPEDAVVLFFAGHGFADARTSYLAGRDAKLDALPETAISSAALAEHWGEIRATRKVILADACHSGGLANVRGIGGVTLAPAAPATSPPPGAAGPGGVEASLTVCATGANELSTEDPQLGQGVFTLTLLRGLRGDADADKDGRVTGDELARFLDRELPVAAARCGGKQTAVVGGTPDGRRLALTRDPR